MFQMICNSNNKHTDMATMYTVCAYVGDDFVFQSDVFGRRGDAMKLIRKLQSTNTGDLSYQLFKHYPKGQMYGPVDYLDVDYSGLTLYLQDEESDTYILEETSSTSTGAPVGADFLGGSWDNDRQGWLFDGSHVQMLESMGVTIYQGEEDEVEEEQIDLSAFSVRPYKRGLLVTCDTSHSLYGEPTLLSDDYEMPGYWNETLRGWTFRTAQLDTLTSFGATQIKQESSSSSRSQSASSSRSQSASPFSGMKYYTYGQGYLLVPPKSHQSFGEKYFHNGFWMPKNNGWFFRGRFKSQVENSDASFKGDF
jgi:hypothetical protein